MPHRAAEPQPKRSAHSRRDPSGASPPRRRDESRRGRQECLRHQIVRGAPRFSGLVVRASSSHSVAHTPQGKVRSPEATGARFNSNSTRFRQCSSRRASLPALKHSSALRCARQRRTEWLGANQFAIVQNINAGSVAVLYLARSRDLLPFSQEA